MSPFADNVRASPWLLANNLLRKNKLVKHVNRQTCKHTWVRNQKLLKKNAYIKQDYTSFGEMGHHALAGRKHLPILLNNG